MARAVSANPSLRIAISAEQKQRLNAIAVERHQTVSSLIQSIADGTYSVIPTQELELLMQLKAKPKR